MRLKIVIQKDKTKYLGQFGEIDPLIGKNFNFFCNKLWFRASIKAEEHVTTQNVHCFFIQLQFGLKSRNLEGSGFFYF